MRRRARERHGIGKFHSGAVTFVQRFGGALNLNLHFHTLVLDGVYVSHADGDARFLPLPAPDDAEVARVTMRVAHRIARLLECRGLTSETDPDEADPLARDDPLLAALYSAAVRGRIATGPSTGRRVARLGDRIDVEEVAGALGTRCAEVAGVSVHANVSVQARDRERLERLCRYVARPPVATERLSLLPDGRVAYGLRNRWRDGTTHVAFEPLDFVAKLAALVPPPRFNTVRYHGVLAAAACLRSWIVPEGRDPAETVPRHAGCSSDPASPVPQREAPTVPAGGRPPRLRNYSWAQLMRRVWAVDVLECSECHGRMRILAAIHSAEAIRAILDCLGLPPRAPPVAAAAPEREDDPIGAGFAFSDPDCE